MFLPLVGAVVIAFMGRERTGAFRWVALLFSLLTFLMTVALYWKLDAHRAGMQFEEFHSWIAVPPVNYHLGVDGLSMLMILLTGILTPLSVLVSWTSITRRPKEFFLLLLALETGMIGVFAALDLVLFFLFWEVMLIPMYFLIGVWGHERRVYAAIKFVLFTMAGSALMLTGDLFSLQSNRDVRFATNSWPTVHRDRAHPARRAVAFPGLFHRFRHQGAAVSVPHLAA